MHLALHAIPAESFKFVSLLGQGHKIEEASALLHDSSCARDTLLANECVTLQIYYKWTQHGRLLLFDFLLERLALLCRSIKTSRDWVSFRLYRPKSPI